MISIPATLTPMSFEPNPPAQNTDRELWRREGDDKSDPENYYQPSIHVTEHGLIGISVGGTVHVRPIVEWMQISKAFKEEN